MQKNILIWVEHDFYQNHVGVRGVIRYYWDTLVSQGHIPLLVTKREGKIFYARPETVYSFWNQKLAASHTLLPDWCSADKPLLAAPKKNYSAINFPWHIYADFSWCFFDESIITAPWLLVDPLFKFENQYSLGIVYDMAPIHLALGVLRLPKFLDVYNFAYQHSQGYDFYIENVQRISCISEYTRQDFLNVYGNQLSPRVEVCVPFADFGDPAKISNKPEKFILLINALDYRKNFFTIAKSLKEAAAKTNFKVIVVGQERMPFADVITFFRELADVCTRVEWYRSPDSIQLEQLILKSKVLFFPSFYEGLGLPILEAQAKGVPVLSSNSSSCAEINQNPNLMADPDDYMAFSKKLVEALEDEGAFFSGHSLRLQQLNFLKDKNHIRFK